MPIEIVYTDTFGIWWDDLGEREQESVWVAVELLRQYGTQLPFPHSSAIKGSKIALRELRVQHAGDPYRVLYAFDPKRQAVLLIGGNKAGDNRFYTVMVPQAERLFGEYLKEIKEEE